MAHTLDLDQIRMDARHAHDTATYALALVLATEASDGAVDKARQELLDASHDLALAYADAPRYLAMF